MRRFGFFLGFFFWVFSQSTWVLFGFFLVFFLKVLGVFLGFFSEYLVFFGFFFGFFFRVLWKNRDLSGCSEIPLLNKTYDF